MTKINISPKAIEDLQEIKRYIEEELCNSQAALNVVTAISEKIGTLREFSNRGASLDTIPYRYLVCESYLVFYRNEADDVFVDRVIYSGRDYLKLLMKK